MAKAQLQELVVIGCVDRDVAASGVREAAAARILAAEEDEQVKMAALAEVVQMSADALLPAVH